MNDFIELISEKNWLINGGGPRYLQLRKRIQNAIENGVLKEHEALPSEREIAALTELSRVTVRKAVSSLVKDQLVVQKRGSGSFVAPKLRRVEQRLSSLTSFTEDMAQRGRYASSEWLQRGICLPTSEEMLALGLPSGERVARVERLRKADDVPMAIERASLPERVLPHPEKVADSLYAELTKSGQHPVRAVQRITARNLGAEDAGLLGVKSGNAGLKIERISYSETGNVLEFTRSVYRGDAYDFVAELKISDPLQ